MTAVPKMTAAGSSAAPLAELPWTCWVGSLVQQQTDQTESRQAPTSIIFKSTFNAYAPRASNGLQQQVPIPPKSNAAGRAEAEQSQQLHMHYTAPHLLNHIAACIKCYNHFSD